MFERGGSGPRRQALVALLAAVTVFAGSPVPEETDQQPTTIYLAQDSAPVEAVWLSSGSAGRVVIETRRPDVAALTVTTETIEVPLGRISATIDAGAVSGTEQTWDGAGWADEPGSPRITLAEQAIETPVPPIGESQHSEVALVVTLQTDDGTAWTSDPMRFDDLLIGSRLRPAPWAWRGAGRDEGRWVPADASMPALQLAAGFVEVTVPPQPTDIDGVGVAAIHDSVLIQLGAAAEVNAILHVDSESNRLWASRPGSDEPLPMPAGTTDPSGAPPDGQEPGGGWSVASPSGGIDDTEIYQVSGTELEAVIGSPINPDDRFTLVRGVSLTDGSTFRIATLATRATPLEIDPMTGLPRQDPPTTASRESRFSPAVLAAFGAVLLLGIALALREVAQSSWWRRRRVGRRWRRRAQAQGREL